MHYHIALTGIARLSSPVGIKFVYLSAGVTSIKSTKRLLQASESDGQTWLGPINRNTLTQAKILSNVHFEEYSRQLRDRTRRWEISQGCLARRLQSRGIKQSVTQPVTIPLITPIFNTPWKKAGSQTCKHVPLIRVYFWQLRLSASGCFGFWVKSVYLMYLLYTCMYNHWGILAKGKTYFRGGAPKK